MMSILALCLLDAPWVESKEFPRPVQEIALQATLRLTTENPRGEGTAVRIGRQGPFVYYVTVNHNVEKVEKAKLEAYTAKMFPKVATELTDVKVMARRPESDLAILRSIENEPPAYLPVVTAKLKSDPKHVLTVGCTGGKTPELMTDEVEGSLTGRTQLGVKSRFWKAAKPPGTGRSGGPMIDVNGCLIGICGGIHEGKGYYIHLDELRSFLKTEGLQDLDYSIQPANSKR